MFEKNPNLTYRLVMPCRIDRTTRVKMPNALLGAGKAVLLCERGEASMLIDFHEEVVGSISLKVKCAESARVTLIYEEDPDAAMRREEYICSWYRQPKDEYSLASGEHTLLSQGRRGFRYAGVFVQSKQNVEVIEARAISGGWAVKPRGSFCCSDDRINRIWDISTATVRACMQDFYEDGVKRDGLLWIGDYRMTFLCSWYAFGDAALARKSLLMIRDSQYENGALPACSWEAGGHQHYSESGIRYMPGIPHNLRGWVIPNYVCDYVAGLEEYVRLTGDESIIPETIGSAERAARFLCSLIDFEDPSHWWMDAHSAKRNELGQRYSMLYDCNMNPKSEVTSRGALLFEILMALRALDSMAQRVEKSDISAWAQQMAAKVDHHIETYYRENRFGQYIDSFKQHFGGVLQHVTARAVAAGKDDPKGMERLVRSLMPNLGFAMAWRLEAMFKTGYVEQAISDIRKAWGKMLDADSLTCWERLDTPQMNDTHYYDAPGSLCHGWTAGPAWLLPRWITGVQIQSDGFEVIHVCPELGDLEWAEANVPTPNGEIFVRAEKTDGGLNVYLDIPEDVRKCSIEWNGKTIDLHDAGAHELIFSDY